MTLKKKKQVVWKLWGSGDAKGDETKCSKKRKDALL